MYTRNLFCLLVSSLLVVTQPLVAQTATKARLNKPVVYAGIEVGAKGVKMSVVEMNMNAQKGSAYKTLKDTSVNSDFISFTQPSFFATLDGLVLLYHKAITDFQLPGDRIFTAISSGVKGQAEKENKQVWISNLIDSFLVRIADPKRKVPVIDVLEEARLSHLGIVPEARRYATFLIDIGSGNTKGGYFPNGNTDDFNLFQLNWGTKSTFNQTEKRCEDDKTLTNYYKQLNRVLAGAAGSDVVLAVNQSGAYSMNDYIAFSGGIAWSVSTLLYPELIDNPVVPVTYEEVEKLYHQLYQQYTSLSETVLSQHLADKALDKTLVAKEIKRVHTVFDQKALLAGTGLLLKIMRQFQGVYEKKEFYLVKNGQVGWISAYVKQQLNP
ncbi:MAG: hypothetical protein RLY16_2648 [Bacteroidota bacterium]|jgi:hypothetical protein